MLLKQRMDRPFDIVITDLQMETDFSPELAGEWLIKQVRNFDVYKNTPIVIVSATYNIAFVAQSLGAGYLSTDIYNF